MSDDLFGFGRAEIACEGCRFVLTERWGPRPLIGYLGMNPSLAGQAKTDPTFTDFNGRARRLGYGGTVWGNLVPFRSSQPADAMAELRRLRDGHGWDVAKLLDRNLDELRRASPTATAWVCGWGAGGEAMDAIWPVIEEACAALGHDVTFLALGRTASGAPKHVLARGLHRIPRDVVPEPFDPFSRNIPAAT